MTFLLPRLLFTNTVDSVGQTDKQPVNYRQCWKGNLTTGKLTNKYPAVMGNEDVDGCTRRRNSILGFLHFSNQCAWWNCFHSQEPRVDEQILYCTSCFWTFYHSASQNIQRKAKALQFHTKEGKWHYRGRREEWPKVKETAKTKSLQFWLAVFTTVATLENSWRHSTLFVFYFT